MKATDKALVQRINTRLALTRDRVDEMKSGEDAAAFTLRREELYSALSLAKASEDLVDPDAFSRELGNIAEAAASLYAQADSHVRYEALDTFRATKA